MPVQRIKTLTFARDRVATFRSYRYREAFLGCTLLGFHLLGEERGLAGGSGFLLGEEREAGGSGFFFGEETLGLGGFGFLLGEERENLSRQTPRRHL